MNLDEIDKLDAEADAEINALSGAAEEPAEENTEVAEDAVADESNQAAESAEETVEQQEEQSHDESLIPESRYKDAVRAMNKAQQELADRRKRDAEVEDYIQKLHAYIEQLKAEGPTQEQAKTTSPSADVSNEELQTAQDLFPEVMTPLMKTIEALKAELAAVKGDVGNVKTVADDYTQQRQRNAQEQYWATIRDYHPDVDAIANSQEYQMWYEQQPPMIQQALQSPHPGDVIQTLHLFKQAYGLGNSSNSTRQQPSPPKTDKLAAAKAAAGPSVKSTLTKPNNDKKFTLADIEKMSNEDFVKNEALIDELYAKGELV